MRTKNTISPGRALAARRAHFCQHAYNWEVGIEAPIDEQAMDW